MNSDIFVLIVSITLLGVSFFSYYTFRKRYNLFFNTETSKITTLKKGFCEIKGKVKFLDNKLTSPLSKEDCVYYRFKVEEERGSSKSSHWHTIIDDESKVRFAIQDSSGLAYIDMPGAKLIFSKDAEGRTGLFKKATPELEQAMAKYQRSAKGWLFDKTLKYYEKFVKEGDQLYVLGEVKSFEGYYPVFSKGDLPFYISDKPEEELLQQAKLFTRLSFFVLALTLAGIAFYLWYRNYVV